MLGKNQTLEMTMDEKECFVPHHIRDGIFRYIDDGIMPGGFVMSILENDLKSAVGRADDINIEHIPSIVRWFYNFAPSNCWGSPDTVINYINFIEGRKCNV